MTTPFNEEARAEARRRRKEIINDYSAGELTLSDIVELSKIRDNRALKKIRVHSLISKKTGWSEGAVKATLTTNKYSPEVTILDVSKNKELRKTVDMMEASTFLKMTSPPEIVGWPWKGSVLAVIKDMGPENIGREILDIKKVVLDEHDEPEPETEKDDGVSLDSLFDDDTDETDNDDSGDVEYSIDDILSGMN